MSTEILFEEQMKSVERASQRGVNRFDFDLLGKLFSGARKSLKLSIDDLSEKTGIAREDLIDLELGSFFLAEAVSIAEKLKDILQIEDKDYKYAVMKSKFKR